ncbi:Rep family protein [Streptococcaceae bacterium ESL0729]|nr:Rep family protein [Streptococcaceae bacterium ESL0729]
MATKTDRYKILSFEQQLKAKYWDWDINKTKLFEDIELNKDSILEEIYNRLASSYEDFATGMIIHDKDVSGINDLPVYPHVHVFIEFKGKTSISKLSNVLGIEPQFIKKPSRGPHNKDNLLAYLIHAKNPDKHMYDPKEVKTFDTFDYIKYYNLKSQEWINRKAVVKRKNSNLSLDYILEEIDSGKLKYLDLIKDPNLRFMFRNNQNQIRDALNFYGEVSAVLRLEELKNKKYDLTVLYIEGSPGVGKTYFAR